MKQLAISGAPGSGKTEFAKELEMALPGEVIIIDDYIQEIEKECDLLMGEDATYVGEMFVLLGRFARERQAKLKKPDWIITCGSPLDTVVHAATKGIEDQTEESWFRIQGWMNFTGIFFTDTWRYEHLFILSLDDQEVGGYKEKINSGIPDAIESFNEALDIPCTFLKGTIDERVKQAMEIIDELESKTAE